MEIEFSGAAREVTGSCHILRIGDRTVLLDCGLFQGHRRESRDKNLKLPCSVDEIDAVVLSHAHIDHAGQLPVLARAGYRGTIYCTPATRDLSAIMLADSAFIQEKDAEFLARQRKEHVDPLYDLGDATSAVEQMVSIAYHKPFDAIPGVRVTYVDAGHILGSASSQHREWPNQGAYYTTSPTVRRIRETQSSSLGSWPSTPWGAESSSDGPCSKSSGKKFPSVLALKS